ncbi:glucuronyl hydrolase [Pseudomonas sp. BP8]|uniref:glucuronyl hydrolase n=1 Tax=Pseudomonas sp. BP8 TaxID=2817864 RepID=UPI001AE89765|nr:glucuronyl hydrolase [Pseudomonas sp. BP8]MBP2260193.1 unsaturated chondroitin disaccharide hydrolase [Pseudomonas sp. BP8]HDS1737543.1 glucuronyl hydrolase [Pseudomonas putida]
MPEQRKRRAAINALLKQLDSISRQCGEQFPLYRLPRDKQWKLSRRGSWLGGFWTALWWRRAAFTELSEDHDQAAFWCRQLVAQLDEPSLNRSFVFWYGAALGGRLAEANEARQLACRAADALARDYHPEIGGWPLGPGMGGGDKGRVTLDIDALAPTLALMHLQRDAGQIAMARNHLELCLRTLRTPTGAWASYARWQADGSFQQGPAGQWARGQAWAMLGLAEAVGLYGGVYADAAREACEYWVRRWGESASQGALKADEADPCAVAIASVALLRLWQCLPGMNDWRDLACRQIAALLSAEVQQGSFVGHFYRVGAEQEQLVESACATYFLVEALLTQDQVLALRGGIAGW